MLEAVKSLNVAVVPLLLPIFFALLLFGRYLYIFLLASWPATLCGARSGRGGLQKPTSVRPDAPRVWLKPAAVHSPP